MLKFPLETGIFSRPDFIKLRREINDFNLLKSPGLAEYLKESYEKVMPMYSYFKALPLEEGGNL